MKNNKKANYATGAYGCLKEELLNVIDDLDDDEIMYVISARTDSGLTIYSFPMCQTKIRDLMEDLVQAMKDEDVFKLGTTWVNTKCIMTVRIVKHFNDYEEEY